METQPGSTLRSLQDTTEVLDYEKGAMHTKVYVVTQPRNPTSGGGHTLQENIVSEIKKTKTECNLRWIICTSDFFFQPTTLSYMAQEDSCVAWFLYPELRNSPIPYFSTIWDLGHLDYPFFPELKVDFDYREKMYSSMVKAFRVFVGTNFLKERVISRYCLLDEKVVVNPFIVEQFGTSESQGRFPKSADLTLIYPAQFWKHKNHLTLINSLPWMKKLIKNNIKVHLTGSDKGNLSKIQLITKDLGFSENIFFHGFLPKERLTQLLLESDALIYPSLLGPDNLPPLEALAAGIPAVVSDIPGAREVYGESCLYFPPMSSEALATQVSFLYNAEVRDRVLEKGVNLIKSKHPAFYVKKFLSELRQLIQIIRL